MIDLTKVSNLIKNAKHLVVFTGAGISVESGIPPFSGSEGLWSKYDPKFIELSYFLKNPIDSWKEIHKIFYKFMEQAKPNVAHLEIAKLEKNNIVKFVITQNIDNLHQTAGSKNVIEFHGTTKILKCLNCGNEYEAKEKISTSIPPVCDKCYGILKPKFVFYGENIDHNIHNSAFDQMTKADVIIIVGTSGQVMPANSLPYLAKQENTNIKIIEINPNKSSFTNSIVDFYFPICASEFFKELSKII